MSSRAQAGYGARQRRAQSNRSARQGRAQAGYGARQRRARSNRSARQAEL